MASFETNVAGVTFYDVDFSKIKPTSKVELIPEPDNKYDSNAIKVVIGGKHVGYIKKTMNGTILNLLNDGAQIRAHVKTVVGGENGKNNGIVLSISAHEQREQPIADDLGKWSNKRLEDLTITKAIHPINALSESIPTWESFLEICKGVPSTQSMPAEPDYELLYKESTSFFRRLLSNDMDEFKKGKKHEWKIICNRVKQENEQRDRLIEGYSKSDYAEEFQRFILTERIKRAFVENRITVNTAEAIREMYEKGYLSSYENLLFENLTKVYPAYQQAKYEGFLIDILLVAPEMNMLWAIEVDGNVHRTKTISKRDTHKVDMLTATGVSVIRVTNFYIGHQLETAVKKIIETVGG